MNQKDWSDVLRRAHCIQRNRNADVVRVGITACHGTNRRFRDRPPEEQEAQQTIEKAYDGC
ncbi:hypothetical protein J2Y41_001888 [Arthrobacter sp. 1088]|nr:hypothetical protein [Arthrobacter sp. 1088]